MPRIISALSLNKNIMKKNIFIVVCIFCFNVHLLYGQSDNLINCNFKLNESTNNIFVLDESNLNCLVEQKQKFIIYSYAFWCSPCVEKLPEVIQFCQENKIELFILLIHNQESDYIEKENIFFQDKNLNVLVLSDSYGKRPRMKYKQFLTKYYPNEKIIDDLSKIILYSDGQLKYVSTWMDGKDVLETKIKPILN